MEKHNDPSDFFVKSTSASQSDEDGRIAPASSNSFSYFLIFIVIISKDCAYTWLFLWVLHFLQVVSRV